MTTTSELIEHLVADLRPLSRHLHSRRLAAGLLIGVGASVLLMLAVLGPRQDFGAALSTEAFWLKAGYASVLAFVGLWAVSRLSGPERDGVAPAIAGTVLLATFAGFAVSALFAAPAELRPDLVLGKSALVCPWLIALLAAPVLAGLLWAVRGLAPTRLPAAGLAAGLTAGAVGAGVYALHCPESGIPFIALWYTAGMAISGVIGLLAASRLLRW
jgi:hypothetical protein